jgi:rhodanese-related sulfurtransferase
MPNSIRVLAFLTVALGEAAPGVAATPAAVSVAEATLAEPGSRTPEVSTAQLREVLAARTAVLLDARPDLEWAISHIPAALNVAPRPGMPMSRYTSDVAEIGRIVEGDRSRALILYCNGPSCAKSRRLAADLLQAGSTDVRRYQLGAPVWRALGGVMVTEPDGARHVFANDGTAVWIDARDAAEFTAGSLAGARSCRAAWCCPAGTWER